MGISSGGEFIVKKEINSNDVPSGELFRSFCLEYNEHIKRSTDNPVLDLYEFTISSITEDAENGGVGGQTPGTNKDPLDPMTAFLYYNYRMGLLDDLTGFTFSYNTDSGANAAERHLVH